jgi:hypothetical protein
MKDGRTHLAYKAEHAVDVVTEAIVAATVTLADKSDPQSAPDTLSLAGANLVLTGSQEEIKEAVMDKGYHDNGLLAELTQSGVRTYIPERRQKSRRWTDKPIGKRSDEGVQRGGMTRVHLAAPTPDETLKRTAREFKSPIEAAVKVQSCQISSQVDCAIIDDSGRLLSDADWFPLKVEPNSISEFPKSGGVIRSGGKSYLYVDNGYGRSLSGHAKKTRTRLNRNDGGAVRRGRPNIAPQRIGQVGLLLHLE